ncbi:MAG: serine/threonine-protein kinase [bacterium]|nr:serine/threonine-protein kinase [bacterium]
MNQALYRAAKPIFEIAFELPSDQRAAYVERESGDDTELREFVMQLLEEARETAALATPGSGALDHAIARSLTFGEEPGARIDRFELRERIGEGGFGAVWRAEQLEPVKREVAVKLLKPGMDTRKVIARFQAERQALALMDHPSIAQVYDGGATPTGRPYFAMELVDGVPITRRCRDDDLPLRDRLDLFVKVCGAIQHAHQKGVIHRDVKPSNVLVTEHEGTPFPKVIDFGIAKAIAAERDGASQLTEEHQIIGTPEYMAPEQLDGATKDIDTRADVYALGVLLYELLTESRPFEAGDRDRGFSGLIEAIRHHEPQKPSTRVGTRQSNGGPTSTTSRQHVALRGDLDWIVLRALAKDRNDRYESVGALADDIGRHLRNEPVLAGPPSTTYRLRKFVARNRTAVVASVVVLLSLVAGLVGTGVALDWALAEKARADARFTLALDAVDDYHTGVAEDAILKRPELAELRTRLLQAPRAFYGRLQASLAADSLPESREALARALHGLATVAVSAGRRADAIESYRRAAALRQQLADDGYRRDHQTLERARLLGYLGALHLADARLDEAVAALTAATTIEPDSTSSPATRLQLERLRADAGLELGRAHRSRGDRTAAESSWQRALARYRLIQSAAEQAMSTAASDEEASGDRTTDIGRELAATLHAMGQLTLTSGRSAEAIELLTAGVATFEELLTTAPDEAGLLSAIARCSTDLGRASARAGDPHAAKAALERAVALAQRAHDAYPAVPEHRRTLGAATSHLASTHFQLRDFRAAERQYRRALGLLDDADSDGERRVLAHALAKSAEMLVARRNFKAALERLERAAAILDELLPATEDLELIDLAAACWNNLAGATQRAGDAAAAPTLYERAIALRERLLEAWPDDAEQHLHLCRSLLSLARLHFDAERFTEAIPFYSRSIDAADRIAPQLEDPRRPDFLQLHRGGYWGRDNSHQRNRQYGAAAQDWLSAARIDAGEKRPSFLVQMLADLERGDLLGNLETTVASAVTDSGAVPADLIAAAQSFLAATDVDVYPHLAVALAGEAVTLAENREPDALWRCLDLLAAAQLATGELDAARATQQRAIDAAPADLESGARDRLEQRLAEIARRRSK